MKANEVNAKIEKIKAMNGLSDKAKQEMIAVWQKKIDKSDKRTAEEVTLLKTKIDPKYGQEIITVKKNKNGKWSVFSKSDAWKEREELPDGTDSEASAMKIAKELASYTKEFEQAKSKPGNKADWERSVIDAFADKNDMTNSDAQGVFDVHESAMNKAFDAGTSAKVAANQLEKISTKPKPAKKEKKEPKPKMKTVHKYKGKAVNELNDMDCEELIKETQERRKKAAKAEKKSKSKPIIEKVTAPIVRAVKKAIENIPAADLKDKPGTELTRIDKAIAATKRFMMELKTILGDDFDKDTVEDEMKDLHVLAKELHKKYGE